MAVDYTKRHLMDGLAGIPQVARQREALAYPGYLNATAPLLTIGRVLGTNPVPKESLPFAQIPWEISEDQCAISARLMRQITVVAGMSAFSRESKAYRGGFQSTAFSQSNTGRA